MENNTTIFIQPHPLKTAVLFLVFNRLDTTKQVFEAIQKAKPPKLYIAADGARNNREGESEKVKEVRDFILNNINWQCEIKTLFREKNLGCKYAVSSAITWFFEQEEMGIVLEDDCLPTQSFFWFCEELLQRYKDEMRVWHIGGINLQNGIIRGDGDYYFSKYNHVWGWAGWASRWKFYDVEISTIKDSNFIQSTFKYKSMQRYWINNLKKIRSNKIDTWDYQWAFTIWANNGLAILPNVNLILNIGFGEEAFHTQGESPTLTASDLTIKKHPSEVVYNEDADYYQYQNYDKSDPIFIRIINKLKKIFSKIF